jgi:mycothiol synthase
MLARRGFAITESFLWMALDAGTTVAAEAPAPDGVTLRPARHDATDDAAWKRLNEEGYGGGSEYIALTDADLETNRAEEGFHLWIAERDGRAVGFCHTDDFGRGGCVNSLVVSPSERGRGTGRALFLAGVRTLRERGRERIRLSVRAENTPAVSLYRSVGFETADTMSTWQRPPRE